EAEKSEGEIITLRNEKLQTDVDHKNSQLASATMHLVQKSEILVKVKNELNNLLANASIENKKKIQQIGRTIEADIRLDDNWDQFESHFDQVHENFFKRLRKEYPDLTPKDQKLCAYLRMNLTTKEVAPLMNISIRGVEISRYRLRKKLNMDPDTNLVSFILNI
ncbi:MAG: DNA-binding CsgD family transcriptional regulator, partial [Saprospiraceae bacterium]